MKYELKLLLSKKNIPNDFWVFDKNHFCCSIPNLIFDRVFLCWAAYLVIYSAFKNLFFLDFFNLFWFNSLSAYCRRHSHPQRATLAPSKTDGGPFTCSTEDIIVFKFFIKYSLLKRAVIQGCKWFLNQTVKGTVQYLE